jgi:hypothetical protein
MIVGVIETATLVLVAPLLGLGGLLCVIGGAMILLGGFLIASVGGLFVAAGYVLYTSSARAR